MFSPVFVTKVFLYPYYFGNYLSEEERVVHSPNCSLVFIRPLVKSVLVTKKYFSTKTYDVGTQ